MAPFSIKNRIIAPTFANGVNGWTVSGAGGTLSTAMVDGVMCLKVTVPAGSGTTYLHPPSFDPIPNPYRVFAFAFRAASSHMRSIYYGFERRKPTGVYHNQGITTSPSLTASLQKFGNFDYLGPDNAAFIGYELPRLYMIQSTVPVDYYFTDFTWIDAADQEHYPYLGNGPQIPLIAGSFAATDSYSYSWEGTPEASASIATHKASLTIPATFNRGDTINVTGTGFPASSTADIIIADHWNRPAAKTGIPTDASGNLSTTVTVPFSAEPGAAYIIGKPANGSMGSMNKQNVWTNPTDLSTVTNLFPNPNGQTLGVDGVLPKYFGPLNDDTTSITRVSVDGGYRARIAHTYGSVYADLGGGPLTALGLDSSKQYIIKGRMHSAVVSGDQWAYLQTSDGNSDNDLNGPSPWGLIGVGTGSFTGPGELIAYGWPDGSTVDLDQVMIVEAAAYLLSWAGPMPMKPGSTLDGHMIGLRPGRTYEIAGYTYGTFKVRTGTSSGTLSDLFVWSNVNPDEWTGGTPVRTFTVPEGHTSIQLEASGAYNSQISIHDYVPYFDGDTPDGDGYTYSWAGAPHDSASIRSAGSTTLPVRVFVGGVAVQVAEARVVTGGILTPVTQIGT